MGINHLLDGMILQATQTSQNGETRSTLRTAETSSRKIQPFNLGSWKMAGYGGMAQAHLGGLLGGVENLSK